MDAWNALTVAALESLGPQLLEQLCYELVRQEAYDRFGAAARVEGPVRGPDGGRDVSVFVTGPPFIDAATYQQRHALEVLIADGASQVVYSCKAGQKPMADQVRELGEGHAARPRAALSSGGYFRLVTNRAVARREDRGSGSSPHDKLVEAFRDALGAAAPG